MSWNIFLMCQRLNAFQNYRHENKETRTSGVQISFPAQAEKSRDVPRCHLSLLNDSRTWKPHSSRAEPEGRRGSRVGDSASASLPSGHARQVTLGPEQKRALITNTSISRGFALQNHGGPNLKALNMRLSLQNPDGAPEKGRLRPCPFSGIVCPSSASGGWAVPHGRAHTFSG